MASRTAALGVVSALLLASIPARADVSSWLSAGGGAGMKKDDTTGKFDRAASMSFAIGVGSDPTQRFVGGGILRSTTYFGLGTDLGVSLRLATGGFARGDWGLALDAGPMWRTFGSGQYGRWPVAAMLTGGMPWGLQVAVGAELFKIAGDDANAQGFVALLELDLLRLTVMRQGSTSRWWENPAPAGGRVSRRPHPLAGLLF